MKDYNSMYRKIENPFTDSPEYICFGCSPDNEHGLKMEFFEDDNNIYSRWTPSEYFQGYRNIIHGGIQATIADEIAGWFIMHKLKTAGLTKKLEVKYISKIFTNQGDIHLKASLKHKGKKSATVLVEISNSEGNVCTEAVVEFFILPREIAQKKIFNQNK